MTGETERHLHLFVKQVRFGTKSPALSFELRPDVHAVFARSDEQGENFVRYASGMAQPTRGKILLGRTEPGRSPELRARIGSLLRNEPPLFSIKRAGHAGTVREYLAHVLKLRHDASGTASAAGPPPEPQTLPYVAELLDRPVGTLNNQERRHVALGLALSIAQPLLLVLHDPLFDLTSGLAPSLLEKLAQYAKAGAIVACVVPTERAARQLSERIHPLEPSMHRDMGIRFLIRSERPRDVAGSLARSRSIISTQIHPNGDLIVSAASEETAAADITQALSQTQVEVFEVRRVSSPEAKSGA